MPWSCQRIKEQSFIYILSNKLITVWNIHCFEKLKMVLKGIMHKSQKESKHLWNKAMALRPNLDIDQNFCKQLFKTSPITWFQLTRPDFFFFFFYQTHSPHQQQRDFEYTRYVLLAAIPHRHQSRPMGARFFTMRFYPKYFSNHTHALK